MELTPEERDTNAVWGIAPRAERVAWLAVGEWQSLGPGYSRALLLTQCVTTGAIFSRRSDFLDLLPGCYRPTFCGRSIC